MIEMQFRTVKQFFDNSIFEQFDNFGSKNNKIEEFAFKQVTV